MTVTTPCIEWSGARQSEGYGHRTIDGKQHLVHRLAYEAEHGPIPDGLEIDHLCRNRACYNVEHLEAVTHPVNQRRACSKLTQALVNEMRALRAEGQTCVSLAARYGVSAVSVSHICIGRKWA